MSERDLGAALEHESGLLGLAGTADMREVLVRAQAGEEDAELALNVYLHRLRGGVAAMTATLAGLDALVFTGGVGERSAQIRARAVDGLGFLGLAIDNRRNSDAVPDREITAQGSEARMAVIRAREDLEIARQVRIVIGAASG
jgi:acetate kinase